MKLDSYRNSSRSSASIMQYVTPIALAAVVAILGATLAMYQSGQSSSPLSIAVEKSDTTSDTLPARLDGLLSPSSVQDIAKNTHDSEVTGIVLENWQGILMYRATLSDGSIISYDARTGDPVTSSGKKYDLPENESEGMDITVPMKTTFEDARKLAQDAFPNGKISHIILNSKDSVTMLHVKFTDASEVDVNAATGEVARITTSRGSQAENPSDSTPSSPSPTPAEAIHGQDDGDNQTGSGQSKTPGSPSPETDLPESDARPDKADVISVEGTLILSNGIYTVTSNDKTYTVHTDKDLSKWVDRKVSVDGTVETDNIIDNAKVHPVND